MKVVVAEYAGACYGVKRAVELAQSARKQHSGKVSTFGPLIHNPLVVSQLEKAGISISREIIGSVGDTIVIRSHGATPAAYKKAQELGICLVDATCPHVLAAQRAARTLAEEAYKLVVVGDAQHAEVQGICAQASDAVCCVVEDVGDLPNELPKKVGVVVQTTQTAACLNPIVEELEKRCKEVKVKRTICAATKQRQEAAVKLSKTVDCMIVIGGHNSANTNHLAELCCKYCKTIHIESSSDLQGIDFSLCKSIGITAGASTFSEQIDQVVEYFENN